MQETTSSGENARPEQGPIEDRTESKGEALSMRVLQSTLALHAEKNLTRLVAMVTDQLRELFGAEQAAVWLLEDRPLGDPADAFPFGEMTSSIHAGLAQAMGAEVLRTGRPVVSPAVGKDARWDKSLRPAFVPIAIGTPADRSAPFVGSAAAFPLRSPQRVLGILYLEHSSREGIFSLDAETLLTLYADQVAVAVEAVLEILRTTTDELTGALTHSSFQAVLDRWLGISRRRRSPLAVVTIDLDQFRMTNEQFGADAGNSILREVSSLIRDKAAAVETRSAGPVGAPRGLCGRYEGDEFEVVLPGMGRPEARHFALKLLEELGTLSGAARPGRPGVSASAGIAIYPEDADAKDGLILKAHEAMREAKRNGRARVVSWGDPAEAATSKTLASTDPEIGSMLVSRDGMTVLGMVNRLLQAGLDLDKTLDLALEMMIEVTKAERGFVVLATAAGEPEVRCARGMNREEIGKPRFRPSFGIVKQVLERGEAVLIPDTLRDARVSDKSSVMNLELRSILSVPIRLEQRLLGAVYLDTRSLEKQFSEEDRDLLAAFARKIARSIANLIEYRDSLKELDRLKETLAEGLQELQTKYSYENIVGKSKEMRKVFQLLDRVTDTSYSVMIYGESGTGKELIAKAIHFNGPRKAKPFVAENCGAIAETLLESELFGHMRGSFTGADQDRKGLFEIASGGTLFLDEISEMSPLMQKKLLRVIEESEIRPVGGKRCIRIDTRIIAASNKNLKGLMERGSFREDLYYRLAVIAILLPALRTRKEDIPLLVEHFLNVAAQGAPSRRKKIDRGALAGLLRHDWPGNVRELKNTIERAVVLCEGSTILPKHIVFEAERGMMSLGEMLPERTPAGAAFAGAAGGQETAGMRSPSGVALSDRQQKLIERLRVAPSITNREYAALVGVSVPTAWRDLSELETAGLIARSGRGRNSTYHLPGRLPRSEP